MGGPAEALFRDGRMPSGFWFGITLIVFVFFVAFSVKQLIRLCRLRLNERLDIVYKV